MLRYRLAQLRCGDSCALSFLLPPLAGKPAGGVRVMLGNDVTTAEKSLTRVTEDNFPVPQAAAEVADGSPRGSPPPFAGVNAAGTPFADSWLVVQVEPSVAVGALGCGVTDALAILIQSKQRATKDCRKRQVKWEGEWGKCIKLCARMPTLLLVLSDDCTDAPKSVDDPHVLYLNFASDGGLPFGLGALLASLRKRTYQS